MKRLVLFLSLALLAAACTKTETTTTTVASEPATSTTVQEVAAPDPGFYVVLMWHQHQPFYPKDENGVYTRPWVRVHATKDYYDMAAMVERYPDVTATFNLTPVLLMQLEDLANGAKDIYWTVAEVPAGDLSETDKQFLLRRFFDVNPRIIERFPRYQELAARRPAGEDVSANDWSEQDFRDLQVLFNLAWTDPDFLEEEPLASLVAKGRDFTEDDKSVLFAEHLRIIQEVIPLHARLWEEGVIEVTTTPLAHPILPLIADTSLALAGDPAGRLPEEPFRQVPDADQQVIRGLDVAERLLGRRPVGMWPGEGSVAQLIMSLFSKNGVQWVATGEDVLAKSLDIGSFTRDASDTVEQGDLLYRPWQAQLTRNPSVPMFFRDVRISDQLAFEYSGMPGDAAAADLMSRLEDIRSSVDVEAAREAGRPYVVSIILDGENAWEHYDNDGKEFLDAMYQSLSEADWVSTITPSEYLDRFGEPEGLEEVFPAAWFQPNFATWIGEEEEATAWNYLYEVRDDLRRAEGSVTEEAYAAAYEKMLFAEGSDWFWWYGADQDSGNDAYFDRAYRELLGQVYDALGEERPAFVSVPIIPQQPVPATQTPSDLLTITVDGDLSDWEPAGRYLFADSDVASLWWAFDRENLYLRVDQDPVLSSLPNYVLYLGAPQGAKAAVGLDGAPLGFGATHLIRMGETCTIEEASGSPTAVPIECSGFPPDIEAAIPLAQLGALESGDPLLIKVERSGERQPVAGPALAQVPDISDVALFLDVEDPLGDDYGPGTYRYPTDAVFGAGSYDLTSFQVGTEDDYLVVLYEVVAPIGNPWGSPRNFSIQTFDLYIDVDPGSGTGARLLIPGRNAALEEGNGWEYGITLEGWYPAIYVADATGSWEETSPSFDILTFGDKGKVVARIPLELLGDGDPATWGYAAVVMSQEGYPATGVRRIRDVDTAVEQWRLGGGPDDINHTRIIDVAYAEEGVQEALLSAYSAVSAGTVDDLEPGDYPQVPLVLP
jgi:alpha-amylase/alpha-mannosidase (GH57 family)